MQSLSARGVAIDLWATGTPQSVYGLGVVSQCGAMTCRSQVFFCSVPEKSFAEHAANSGLAGRDALIETHDFRYTIS